MLVNEIYQGGIRALIDYDGTIFDNMVLPTGLTLQDTVDHIIFKYGDAPLFCPEPAVMKYYIAKWSARRLPIWNRFLAASTAVYNPLENYDRNESLKRTDTWGHKITTDDDLTHGETVTTDDDLINGLIVTNSVSADNATTFQNDTKSANTGTDYRDISEVHTGTDNRDIVEAHSGTDLHQDTNRIHGNIGVMSSQDMLNQELDVIVRLDLMDFIADDWHQEFNLMMYN